jgi:hypothetical protein
MPVAFNCCESPPATDRTGGETEMEVSAALFTVRVVEADTNPDAAVIVVVPGPTIVTTPPGAVATSGLLEVQVQAGVGAGNATGSGFGEVLERVPHTWKVVVWPVSSVGFAGKSTADITTAATTVRDALATELGGVVPGAVHGIVAVIVAGPAVNPDTSPVLLPTVATLVSEEDQATVAVTVSAVPPE